MGFQNFVVSNKIHPLEKKNNIVCEVLFLYYIFVDPYNKVYFSFVAAYAFIFLCYDN